MASTLLAVDDSVTMRKVLEITFAGPDFRVVTANTPDAALQKLKTDKFDLVIADLSLEPMNGYDLCKAVKQASPATPVLLLSSKQNAFDAAKASAAKADEHMDKPFDTQQMIDKVKKLLSAAPAAKPVEKAAAQTTPSMQSPVAASAAAPPKAAAAQPLPAAAAAAAAAAPPQRAKTLIYNPPGGVTAQPPMTAPAVARTPAGPTPVSGNPSLAKTLSLEAKEPTPAPAPAAAAAPSIATAPAAALVNGHLQGKLEGLGLTPQQVEAVAALSREIVERVVWEVVPVLAETIIKEELSRLTK